MPPSTEISPESHKIKKESSVSSKMPTSLVLKQSTKHLPITHPLPLITAQMLVTTHLFEDNSKITEKIYNKISEV